MKKYAYYCLLLLFLFVCNGCSANDTPEQPSPTTLNEEAIMEAQQRQLFNNFASTYNATDYEDFESDIDVLKFSSEIVKKYTEIPIAEYSFDFDDIFLDENNQCIGVESFSNNSYYNIPDNLYDKIIQNNGHCDGIIYKLNKILPLSQMNYSESNISCTKFDKYDVDCDMDIEYYYGVNRCFYYDVVDIYIENQ